MEQPSETTSKFRLPPFLESLAVGVTASVCYLTHLAPFDAVALTWMPMINAVIILLAIISMKLLLKYKLPRVHLVLAVVYYLGIGAWAALLGLYVFFVDARFFLITLMYGVLLSWILFRRRENKLLLLLLLAIVAVYAFALPYDLARMAAGVAVIAGATGVLFASPRRIGRWALLLAVIIALFITRMGMFYFGSEPDKINRVLNEPRLEPVLTIHDVTPAVWKKYFASARYAADNMAGTYTLVGNINGIIALPTGRFEFRELAKENTGDSVLYDIDQNQLILEESEKQRLVVLDDRTLEIVASVHVPGRVFTNLSLDPQQRIVYTGDDFTSDIGVFKLDDYAFDRFIPATASRDALLDEKNRVLIASTWGRIKWIDLHSDTVLHTMWVPDFEIRLAIDTPRRLLYVSLPTLGEIWQLDLDKPRRLAKLDLAPGVRFMRLSNDRRMLFVGGYFDGYLYQIRVPEMELHRKVYVGSRIRALHIAPGDDRVVCASSLGVFRFRFR